MGSSWARAAHGRGLLMGAGSLWSCVASRPFKTSQVKSSQVESSQVESSQVESRRDESRRVKSSRVEAKRGEVSRVKLMGVGKASSRVWV